MPPAGEEPAPPCAVRLEQAPSQAPFLVELFSGGAELASACKAIGLNACALSLYNANLSFGTVVPIDLSLPWGQQLAVEIIQCKSSAAMLWAAPPSGTLSRARERPIKRSWSEAGVPAAPQLRSTSQPVGLPSALQDPKCAEQLKIANELIFFVFRAVLECEQNGKQWFVQNPRNSYLWSFPFWNGRAYYDTDVDQCEYKAPRPNPLRIRSSSDWLLHLSAKCSNNHVHVPWQPKMIGDKFSGFPGEGSRGLPAALAAKVAAVLKEKTPGVHEKLDGMALAITVAAKVGMTNLDENKRKVARTAAAAGVQSRGRRIDQLIPEYREEIIMTLPRTECTQMHRRSRFASARTVGGKEFPKDTQVMEVRDITEGRFAGLTELRLGLPWSPQQFLLKARAAPHPFAATALPDEVARAIFFCCTMGSSFVKERRRQFFAKWEARARELEGAEAELVATLHPDVRPFALKKRPLLMKEILTDLGFGSHATELLFTLLTQGVPMFGDFPETGLFPRREHVATISEGELLKASKWARPALLGSKKPYAEGKMESSLWRKTNEELERGECRGPFSAQELDTRHIAGWLGAKRFGVPQKDDFRPCDDYSAFGQNCTSSSKETIDTEGPDNIVGLAKAWAMALSDQQIHMILNDGSVLKGRRHPELSKKQAKVLRARLIDLEKAYKQVARHPRHAHLAIFGVYCSEKQYWSFFEALALGFGSRNAVLGFNVFARALRFILATGLWVPVSHFFDDFSQIDAEPFCQDSCDSVERLFNLLGWSFKAGPEDLKPASSCFSPLGVQVDLSEPGVAIVSNTAKRITRVDQEITTLLMAEAIHPTSIQALVGTCQFMEAQTTGRTGALALRAVRRAGPSRMGPGSESLKCALRDLGEHIHACVPRRIQLLRSRPPIILLTDAAYEQGQATLGAVLFDQENGAFYFFAGRFTKLTVEFWQRDVNRHSAIEASNDAQVICQAELAVIPVALSVWGEAMKNREALVFIDNNSSKDALIRGISASTASSQMARESRLLCARYAIAPWFDRVPSPSNLADDPSRGVFDLLISMGASRVAPVSLPALNVHVNEY